MPNLLPQAVHRHIIVTSRVKEVDNCLAMLSAQGSRDISNHKDGLKEISLAP